MCISIIYFNYYSLFILFAEEIAVDKSNFQYGRCQEW